MGGWLDGDREEEDGKGEVVEAPANRDAEEEGEEVEAPRLTGVRKRWVERVKWRQAGGGKVWR